MPDAPKLATFPAPGTAEELKEFARDLMADIEAGKLVAVAIVRIHTDGATACGWAWDRDVDSARLIGGAATLQHRLIHELDQ